MKNRSLPVKRKPVRKSANFFRRLSAVTNRQRAATASAEDMEFDESGSGVSKAITILFLIHVVAIVMFFLHQKFLESRTETPPAAGAKVLPAIHKPAPREELSKLAPGEKSYMVKTGDNFARIAQQEGVNEADLRAANVGMDIRPGTILRIPPKKIVAELPPEIAKTAAAAPSGDRGLVEAIDVANAPKALLVRPGKPSSAPASTSSAEGKFHVIKPGENLWRIAAKYNTTPEALKKANGVQDVRKLRPGQKLVIP